MRNIKFGDKTVSVKAGPLALLFYKQEFGADLLGDFVAMQDVADDPTKLDSIALLQLIWSMVKTAEYKKTETPSFLDWVAGLESFDFADVDMLLAVVEEATQGLFRTAAGKQALQDATRKAKHRP